MSSLFARRDVIVVASVSCIYGIGSKEDYEAMVIPVRVGQELSREQFLSRLVDLQYNRNDITFERGQFRVRGDTVGSLPRRPRRRVARGIFRRRNRAHHALRAADGRKAGNARQHDDFSRRNNSSRPATR